MFRTLPSGAMTARARSRGTSSRRLSGSDASTPGATGPRAESSCWVIATCSLVHRAQPRIAPVYCLEPPISLGILVCVVALASPDAKVGLYALFGLLVAAIVDFIVRSVVLWQRGGAA